MLFGGKESQVKDLIQEHIEVVGDCLDVFEQTLIQYLENDPDFEEYAHEVHEKEHQADKVRRRIEGAIYEGAFFPFLREDYITLVELIDRVANRAETVSDIVAQQTPPVPGDMKQELTTLCERVLECYEPLLEVMRAMEEDFERTNELTHTIESIEQDVDRQEWGMIKDLFEREDLQLAEKLLVRDLIQMTASVADRMEDASDRIDIMVVKRKP